MTLWIRYEVEGRTGFGTLDGERIIEHEGDMFATSRPTGRVLDLASVRLLAPCVPGKLIGLWNNFHERAEKEGLHHPEHPLYFLKSANSFAGPGDHVPRPAGYSGMVVFEGELGIVIGRRSAGLSPAEADNAIFGYTCANDITSRDLLKRDPAFVHWTRAKCADRYGVLGPAIATGLDAAALRVRVELNGDEKQNYPVADMIFSPREIVSRISHDMTLDPGDVIICGTSVGVCAMNDGDTVEVIIDGIGRLKNVFG
jgi:2-keto-4-pentenoate hydratase/2-oxohepta-3-ene-1,7-dioic acid hydratase in catechol pathway